MRNSRDRCRRLVLSCVVAMVGTALLMPASAQAPRGNNANGRGNAVPDIQQGPVNLPPRPPDGAWGEVIMANNKWLVVQNHEGQQFPIAMDAVNQFLIRWPTKFRELGPEFRIEAIGFPVANNTVQTDHVDVFAGSDKSLVGPTDFQLQPGTRPPTVIDPSFNRFMGGLEIGPQNLLYGWSYPVTPQLFGAQTRPRIVGDIIPDRSDTSMLVVSTFGNNTAAVTPADPANFTITQVTRGTSSFADKGDLVFLMPINLTSRSVVLQQVVLYKKMSLAEYRPR